MPHWNWKGCEGEIVKVMTHTNCEEVELFLNSKSLGKKPILAYEQAEWGVPYEPGILEMKGYIDGRIVAEARTETTEEAAALIIEPDRDWIYGDGLDAMPVNVCAVDKKGRFVPIANNKVKFSILGDGRIMGVGNGDPNSHETYISNERCLFGGRCQAIIQSLEINEEKTNDINTNNNVTNNLANNDEINLDTNNVITIIAEAEGLDSATVSIKIKDKEAPQYATRDGLGLALLNAIFDHSHTLCGLYLTLLTSSVLTISTSSLIPRPVLLITIGLSINDVTTMLPGR